MQSFQFKNSKTNDNKNQKIKNEKSRIKYQKLIDRQINKQIII